MSVTFGAGVHFSNNVPDRLHHVYVNDIFTMTHYSYLVNTHYHLLSDCELLIHNLRSTIYKAYLVRPLQMLSSPWNCQTS